MRAAGSSGSLQLERRIADDATVDWATEIKELGDIVSPRVTIPLALGILAKVMQRLLSHQWSQQVEEKERVHGDEG